MPAIVAWSVRGRFNSPSLDNHQKDRVKPLKRKRREESDPFTANSAFTQIKPAKINQMCIRDSSHPEFIKRIMEQEIPEVFDGTVEIMSVSREAGDRTKVAVRSHNPNVDAIGTIVGRGGSNIKKVSAVSTQHVWMLRRELKFLLRKILTLFNGLKIQLNLSTMLLHRLKWTMFSLTKMIANVRQ